MLLYGRITGVDSALTDPIQENSYVSRDEWLVMRNTGNNNLISGIRNNRSVLLTILCTLGVFALTFPELTQLIREEPIGDGISELIVGALALILISGLQVLDWVENRRLLTHRQGNFAVLPMISIAIGGSLLVLYYIPDSPEAIGILLVAVPAALLILRDTLSRAA